MGYVEAREATKIRFGNDTGNNFRISHYYTAVVGIVPRAGHSLAGAAVDAPVRKVLPLLTFFVDERRHEGFSDPNHPLYADAGCLLTLPLSLRNSRHPSRMRLAIWIVGLTALATSLDSAYGGFYGRAIARMVTDMANGFGLG